MKTNLKSLSTSAVALALIGSLFWAVPAQAADVTTIPQAPTFSVIAASETLPFSSVGDAPTQVAVLTGSQSLDDATWTTTDKLALASYEGQKIRVLARVAGTTDPANYFDATYDVRDNYESAIGIGTEENPAEAVLAGSPRITGWATGYTDYVPGPNVADSWKTPQNAVGSIAGNPDDPYSGNTTVVVLGDDGVISMTFANPIVDGTGYDFAVFENGFNAAGTQNIFGELARIQVSSNGTDFVEFDSGTTNTTPVTAYGSFPANKYGGVAGRDLNSYGTPFDLTVLKNKPEVRSGKVDLANITYVKIVDIVGDGSALDSFGRPIYDPFPTYGSGGFDLRAVGVMNQKSAAVNPTRVVGLDSTSISVSTAVSAGQGGDHTVELQVADDATGTNRHVVGTGAVAAGEQGKEFNFRVNDVAAGTTLWSRVVVKDINGDEAAATAWKSFTKTPSTVALSSVPSCSRVASRARCSFVGNFTSNTDGTFTRWVEVSESASDHSDARVVGKTTVQSGQILAEGDQALELSKTYWYRYVGELSDGVQRTSPWGTFTANVNPTVYSPALVTRQGGQLSFTSEVFPGSQTALKVSWQYATNSAFTTGVGTLPQVPVSATADSTRFTRTISGLEPTQTYYVRAVLQRDDGSTLNSSALGVAAEAAPNATIQNVVVNAANGALATVQSRVTSHTYGQQSATVEYTEDPSKATVTTTEAVLTSSTANNVVLSGLKPDTTYWARGVWVSTAPGADGHVARSNWFEFRTPEVTDALDSVDVSAVSRTGAAVSVPVTAGVYSRSVRLAYREGADTEVHHTVAQTVPVGTGVVTLPFTLDELAPNSEYQVWAESTIDGAATVESSDTVTFTTGKTTAVLGQTTVSSLSHDGAVVTAAVTAGDADQQVHLEYSLQADGSDALSTAEQSVGASDAAVNVTFALAGIAPDSTVYYRVVTADGDDHSATSWANFSTVKPEAPQAQVNVSAGPHRVGDKVTVSWTASQAESLTASGDWSGNLDPAGGSRVITLDRDGAYTFAVAGVGVGGHTQISTSVHVMLPATNLTIDNATSVVKAGTTTTFRVSGLRAGEPYTITVGGIPVATGTASATGDVNREVTVPEALADVLQRVGVTGSVSDRAGASTLRVVRAKTLSVKVSKKWVVRGKKVRVTVRGLAAGESVKVRLLGKTWRGTANAKGVYVKTVKVTKKNAKKVGRKKVTVTGLDATRKGNTTFKVKKK
jgi:hypothetical protein